MTNVRDRIDDLQDSPFGFAWVALFAAGAVSCVMGYSTVGKWLSSAGVAVIVLWLVIRGIWLQGLWWRSGLAVILLIVSIALTDTAPHDGLTPLAWALIQTSLMAVALWLFYKICLIRSWWPEESTPQAEATV